MSRTAMGRLAEGALKKKGVLRRRPKLPPPKQGRRMKKKIPEGDPGKRETSGCKKPVSNIRKPGFPALQLGGKKSTMDKSRHSWGSQTGAGKKGSLEVLIIHDGRM